jgi:hypothetical protein
MAAVSQVCSLALPNYISKNAMDGVFAPRNAIATEILFAAGKKIGVESAVPTGAGAGGHAPEFVPWAAYVTDARRPVL